MVDRFPESWWCFQIHSVQGCDCLIGDSVRRRWRIIIACDGRGGNPAGGGWGDSLRKQYQFGVWAFCNSFLETFLASPRGHRYCAIQLHVDGLLRIPWQLQAFFVVCSFFYSALHVLLEITIENKCFCCMTLITHCNETRTIPFPMSALYWCWFIITFPSWNRSE